MATPQGPEAEVGEQAAGGAHSRRLADVKAGLRIDTQQLTALNNSLKESRDITREWRLEMEKLAKAASTVKQSMSGVGGGGGGNAVEDGFSNLPETGKPAESATATAVRGGGMARAAGILGVLSPIVGGLTRQLDSRIDRGIAYATSADRLNLLTQQMTGMSQMSAMNQRRELTPYRLGMGGINEMISFQSQTGIQATSGMARSIEAIRTTTGFTKTTADILNEQRQLMDPAVANRMFFMGGVNAYNIGGGMKDPMQMRQEIVQRMGLNNAEVMRSALNPGSITRARMADLGLGEEMQTEILQYAQQNLAFQERGGRGMYDPSKASHRQRMGIENNLATQQEETDRTTVQREEQFMRRQIDNMASLEKSNQALIEAMGSLEDTMSGLIGARISSRPLQRSIGGALGGVGAGLLTAGAVMGWNPAGWGMMAAGGLALVGSALSGDPENPEAEGNPTPAAKNTSRKSSANDNSIMVPYGYNGSRISLSELKNKPDFNKLNPRFKDRLLEMMRVNPNVGVGGGTRDPSAQETMFKSRYERTEEDTGIFWDGSYWKHVSGAAAAPPGRSMHEIGLAADLVGDLAWMNAHASEFGLQHFAGVNNEPWHVQPDDLPRSRSEYEKQGAPWGTDGGFDSEGTSKSTVLGDHASGGQPEGLGSEARLPGLGGLSIQEAMDVARNDSLTRMLAGGGTYPQGATGGTTSGGSRSTTSTATAGSGAELAAAAAYKAGFRGRDLTTIVALAGRESRWNPRAKNPATSDHGMWQINWSSNGDLARSLGASEPEDLFNVDLNARVAFALYNDAKGWAKGSDPQFFPWRGSDTGHDNSGPGWDGDGDHMWHADEFVAEARAATAQYQSGDPTIFEPTRGGATGRSGSRSTTNHITSAPTINVAPVINFNGTPSTPDLRNLAQTVSRLIKQEVDMLDLRTS